MDCGLHLIAAACSASSPASSPGSSPRKGAIRSIKKQWSSKRRSEEAVVVQEPCREWPADPSAYELLEVAGQGAHAVVYKGRCKAYDEVVAIKRLKLNDACDLAALIREATMMKRFNHPAVLPLYASFVAQRELWLVTPYMGLGSVRSIMKQHYPQGLDEVVIATLMLPVLMALDYVHRNNGIHRDIKADNILVSQEGDVILADFGVAAAAGMRAVSMVNLQDSSGMRATTFVGTPCWMAPEVMAMCDEGYHTSADIWSFGITLIELAHGRPPLSRLNPMRVMMDTINKPPPQLGEPPQGMHFSKAFRECVGECLQKDPEQRPSAACLLNHRFFRMARDPDFLREHFIAGLEAAATTTAAQRQQQQQEALALSPSPPRHSHQQQQQQQMRPLGASGGLLFAPPAATAQPASGLKLSSPSSPHHQQQQQLVGGAAAGLGAPWALRGGSFFSGPSASGPSRHISAWLFPPTAQHTAAGGGPMSGRSVVAAATGDTQQQQPAGQAEGSAGAGQEQAQPQVAADTAGVSCAGASPAAANATSLASHTAGLLRTGSCNSASSLEQPHQQVLVRTGSLAGRVAGSLTSPHSYTAAQGVDEGSVGLHLRAGSYGGRGRAGRGGMSSPTAAAGASGAGGTVSTNTTSGTCPSAATRLFAAGSMHSSQMLLEPHAEGEGDEDQDAVAAAPEATQGGNNDGAVPAVGESNDGVIRVVVSSAGSKQSGVVAAGVGNGVVGGKQQQSAAEEEAEEEGGCVVVEAHTCKGSSSNIKSPPGSPALKSVSSFKQQAVGFLSDIRDRVMLSNNSSSPSKGAGVAGLGVQQATEGTVAGAAPGVASG